jgi:plasmid replication initiation protein
MSAPAARMYELLRAYRLEGGRASDQLYDVTKSIGGIPELADALGIPMRQTVSLTLVGVAR